MKARGEFTAPHPQMQQSPELVSQVPSVPDQFLAHLWHPFLSDHIFMELVVTNEHPRRGQLG